MQNYRTETEIKEHILQLIEARKPTQDQAHEEFNKGVKFVTDYMLDFIDTKQMTVFIQKKQKDLVAKIEKLLGVTSYPDIGKGSTCPPGREYKTFLNGQFKEEREAIDNEEQFSIEKQLHDVALAITNEFHDIFENTLLTDDYCIYWRVYPTYETTNVGTYLRMRLALDKKMK